MVWWLKKTYYIIINQVDKPSISQEAGLFMRMEGKVLDNGTPYVQHTAYCDAHTPPDHEHIPKSNFVSFIMIFSNFFFELF